MHFNDGYGQRGTTEPQVALRKVVANSVLLHRASQSELIFSFLIEAMFTHALATGVVKFI